MNRRDFLKFMLSTPLAATIDYEQLLWIPGEKTIFTPETIVSPWGYSDIIALEMERMIPKLQRLFEQDDMFYRAIKSREIINISNREMRVPLIIKPGHNG